MNIEVCLTPALIEQFDLSGKVVVVVDIFRATSCMVAGLSNNVKAIYPVATVDECLALGKKGMLMAGERGGIKIPEFDLGNSPFDYLQEHVTNREVGVSTTNGTLALSKSRAADEILVGAFLNLAATTQYLETLNKDLVIHCAGWKGTVNLEDTLYAGALIDRLSQKELKDDATFLAHSLFLQHQNDLLGAAEQSAHAQRLAGFGIKKDIAFSLQDSIYDTVIRLEGEKLVKVHF
ncbi:MAG: 2-phosphosulfolactate phosphatase [Cytophagales bacterium]|nr:2-phosphosulfolactate phosphatase [Cytophagales bacterium]